MRILNASYAVLSNPALRKQHDQSIEAAEAAGHKAHPADSGAGDGPAPNRQNRDDNDAKPPFGSSVPLVVRIGLVIALLGGFLIYASSRRDDPSGLPPYDQNSVSAADETGPKDDTLAEVFGPQANASKTSTDEAPNRAAEPIAIAPNGSPWPSSAGYVPGYPRLSEDGHSTVTVDNSQNSADVFVKLVEITAVRTRPIRHIFIPGHGTFEMGSLPPGTYDVRYMDLSDGSLARSESFDLEQTEDESGIRFNNITMTLYKVAHGNMETYPLSPSEF